MKRIFAPTLALSLLILGCAGVAWAGQTAVEPPEAAAAEAPEVSSQAGTGEPYKVTLEGLFQEPVYTCCLAQCWDERSMCMYACGGDLACRGECYAQFEACKANC